MIFNKATTTQFFTGYSYGYLLDWRMVLPAAVGGAASSYGFWKQPSGNGCTGYLVDGGLPDDFYVLCFSFIPLAGVYLHPL
jgi:hypothetical protein